MIADNSGLPFVSISVQIWPETAVANGVFPGAFEKSLIFSNNFESPFFDLKKRFESPLGAAERRRQPSFFNFFCGQAKTAGFSSFFLKVSVAIDASRLSYSMPGRDFFALDTVAAMPEPPVFDDAEKSLALPLYRRLCRMYQSIN